ncbi:MAG: hypothetical protein K0S04_554 [Herbinix sp.]|jgi:hypothetical protein|nr:hypothetical protein [Herbinix sp.]
MVKSEIAIEVRNLKKSYGSMVILYLSVFNRRKIWDTNLLKF